MQRVVTAVHRLSRRLDQWYDHQLRGLGLSANEWAVLSELARNGEQPLTPGQLAVAANVAPSSMTHRLDRMTDRGLVRRSVDPEHRARVRVHLTDSGYALYAQAIRDADVAEADVLASLDGAQITTLAELLEQVIAGLDSGPVAAVREP